jgi:hypothetical protein
MDSLLKAMGRFFHEYRWELASMVLAFLLLGAFWYWWVYPMGMDSPLTPSHVVFIFVAMVKVSLFNFLSWCLAIPTTLDYHDEEKTWRTWAVLMLCLSLSALG